MKRKREKDANKRELYRKELNNKGTSLIELLVAITILSLVAVVFYNGFVVSARTNAKAKVQHKATSLAQNIMEALKAESMDSIMQQFVYPTYSVTVDGVAVSYTNFTLLPESIVGNSMNNFGTLPEAGEGPYAVSEDGGRTAVYQKTNSNKYYLYLQNLKMENTAFDVLITIDGSAYTAAGSSGQTYNEEKAVRIPSMDIRYDGIISNTAEYDREAVSKLKLKDNGLQESLIRRTITVDVKEEQLLNGNERQKVTAEYQYRCDADNEYKEMDIVFDNSQDDTGKLRNIYIFFQPAYDWAQDQIIINNSDGVDFNLYLVKQQPENDLTNLAWETTYHIDVEINEPAADPAHIKIRTNLGCRLDTEEKIALNPYQANYKYNGIIPLDPETFFDINTLTEQQRRDKLMDVTVEVFLHETDAVPASREDFLNNAGESKAILQGTIRN